ncbi:MAG: hypothetical protein Q4P66_04475 [Actinomycetaceae bacterium]|nr:hypothetical protein [Actinomycetaceae bacterium]
MNTTTKDYLQAHAGDNSLMKDLPPLPAVEKSSVFYGRWASLIFVLITYGVYVAIVSVMTIVVIILEGPHSDFHIDYGIAQFALIAGVFSVYPLNFGIEHLGQARQKISVYLRHIVMTGGIVYVLVTIASMLALDTLNNSFSPPVFVWGIVLSCETYLLAVLLMLKWVYHNRGRNNTISVWVACATLVIIVGVSIAAQINLLEAIKSGATGWPSSETLLAWTAIGIIGVAIAVISFLTMRDKGEHPITPSINNR